MGTGDIWGLTICHRDHVVTEALNPDSVPERKKTLMQGDGYCDCRWRLKSG
jgi:hypothetical protein